MSTEEEIEQRMTDELGSAALRIVAKATFSALDEFVEEHPNIDAYTEDEIAALLVAGMEQTTTGRVMAEYIRRKTEETEQCDEQSQN